MWHSSSKIDFILNQLEAIWRAYDEDEVAARKKYGNILIFSQWTAMLRYLGVVSSEAFHRRLRWRRTGCRTVSLMDS